MSTRSRYGNVQVDRRLDDERARGGIDGPAHRPRHGQRHHAEGDSEQRPRRTSGRARGRAPGRRREVADRLQCVAPEAPARFALAVLLCGAFAIGFVTPASAFVVIARQATPTSPVVQAHWFPSEFPLESIINAGNLDKPSATALASVLASGEEWENITTSFFSYGGTEYAGNPGELEPALANDGQNSVFFDPVRAK